MIPSSATPGSPNARKHHHHRSITDQPYNEMIKHMPISSSSSRPSTPYIKPHIELRHTHTHKYTSSKEEDHAMVIELATTLVVVVWSLEPFGESPTATEMSVGLGDLGLPL